MVRNNIARLDSINKTIKSARRYPWLVIYTACVIAFTTQMTILTHHLINPSQTVTNTVKRNLTDLEFPMVVKICINPSYNDTELYDVGYTYTWDYFAGISRYNSSLIGWAGHTSDGKVFSNASDIQNRIITEAQEYLSKIFISTMDQSAFYVDPRNLSIYHRLTYPQNCQILDISEVIRGKHVNFFALYFAPKDKYNVEVYLEDKESIFDRTTPDSKKSMTGDKIKIDLGENSNYKAYSVEIRQNVYVEEDDSKGCRKYPNEQFETFNDCDMDSMQRYLIKNYPPGFQPVFMVEDQTLATPLQITDGNYLFYDYIMYNGYINSDCPLSCTQTF